MTTVEESKVMGEGSVSEALIRPDAAKPTPAARLRAWLDAEVAAQTLRWRLWAPVAFGATLEKGDFNIVDLNGSVTVAEKIELGLFAKNLFNQYGILNAPFSFAGSVARPRTIGASVRFSLN